MGIEFRKISVGQSGVKYMPCSEVCMHMRVACRPMRFTVVSERMVQLYKMDGSPFSSPITTGEAGVYTPSSGMYFYPNDSMWSKDWTAEYGPNLPDLEKHPDNIHLEREEVQG